METNKLIIIGVLLIIACIGIGALFGSLNNQIHYERIELSQNGTSLEIPTTNAKYIGDKNGVKFWNWSDGALVSYNSQEESNGISLGGAFGFYAIKELVRSGNSENIDGITIYELNGKQLSDMNLGNSDDTFYCAHIVNSATHDNIVICCKDKNVLIHMVKSINFKNGKNAVNETITSDNSVDNVKNTDNTNNKQPDKEDHTTYQEYKSEDYNVKPRSSSSSDSSQSSSSSKSSSSSGSSSSSSSSTR